MSRAATLRPASAEDLPFLVLMLVEAMNWTGDARATPAQAAGSAYIAGWPRAGDLGVVAEAGDEPVGAVWLRVRPAEDPGYGWVAADVPELTVAVVAGRRGEGIGGRLLDAVARRARERGWRAISLSVQDGNPAARLYRAKGFETVDRVEDADTMLLEL